MPVHSLFLVYSGLAQRETAVLARHRRLVFPPHFPLSSVSANVSSLQSAGRSLGLSGRATQKWRMSVLHVDFFCGQIGPSKGFQCGLARLPHFLPLVITTPSDDREWPSFLPTMGKSALIADWTVGKERRKEVRLIDVYWPMAIAFENELLMRPARPAKI